MLLDEPFGSLDVALKEQLIALVRELLAERQVPTLLVSHGPEEARAMADRAAILEGGTLTQIGPKEALLAQPRGSFAEAFVLRFFRVSLDGVVVTLPHPAGEVDIDPPLLVTWTPRFRQVEIGSDVFPGVESPVELFRFSFHTVRPARDALAIPLR